MINDSPADHAWQARFHMAVWHSRAKDNARVHSKCHSEYDRKFVYGFVCHYAHLSRLEDEFLRGER